MKIYKLLFTLLLLLIFVSCKSKIEAQKHKNNLSSNMENKKPKFSEKDIYKMINPNSIWLTGEVLKVESLPVNLCGIEYKNVLTIKALQILVSGSSIINSVHKGEELQVVLSVNKLKDNIKSPIPNIEIGDKFKAEILEKLCKNNINKTTYFIVNYSEQ